MSKFIHLLIHISVYVVSTRLNQTHTSLQLIAKYTPKPSIYTFDQQTHNFLHYFDKIIQKYKISLNKFTISFFL